MPATLAEFPFQHKVHTHLIQFGYCAQTAYLRRQAQAQITVFSFTTEKMFLRTPISRGLSCCIQKSLQVREQLLFCCFEGLLYVVTHSQVL